MPCWEKNAISNIEKLLTSSMKTVLEKNEIREELAFLNSMMTDRKATYGTLDVVATKKLKKHHKEFLKKDEPQTKRPLLFVENISDNEYQSDNSNFIDSDYEEPSTSSCRQVKKTGTTIHLTPDFLKAPEIISAAIRNKVNAVSLSNIMTALVKSCGGNPSSVNLSYSSVERYMKKTSDVIANTVLENWNPPSKSVLHWDGKIMQQLDNTGKEEHLPVLLSGIGGIKLLGVASLEKHAESNEPKGETIAKETVNFLEKWKCKNTVVGLSFDTTASNTGHKTAACVSLQKKLDRPLLWLPCRHHIGEIVVGDVWKVLDIEKSSSSKVSIFQKLQKHWDTINPSSLVKEDLNFISDPNTTVIIEEYLLFHKQDFPRGDYKELINLCLMYVGCPSIPIKFFRPGALHQARWMAKLIYSLKIVMLSKRLGSLYPTDFPAETLHKMERFVQFAVKVYIIWWLKAPVSKDSPQNDLQLINNIMKYKALDAECSSAAAKAFHRHTWYLTEELVPLGLFSNAVNEQIKAKISKNILDKDKEVSLTFIKFLTN